MPRPKKCRRICRMPESQSFLPEGTFGGTVNMTLDEYEVIRLLDLEGLTQFQCARQIGVARATVTLIYESARKKIADCVVNNKRLLIEGGNVAVCKNSKNCCHSCKKEYCEFWEVEN